MKKSLHKLSALNRICLLALLLAAHTLSFAHELTHVESGDSGLCAVCSISSDQDVPIIGGYTAPDGGPSRLACQRLDAFEPGPDDAALPPVRAPPALY